MEGSGRRARRRRRRPSPGPTVPAESRFWRSTAGGALALAHGRTASAGHAVPVLLAERPGRVFGEGVAVALPVRGAHEGRDHLEIPLGDVGRLAPEVGEPEVDVEL